MLDLVFLGLGLAGLVMNVLLIVMATQVRSLSREILLVISLALVDMVLPFFSILAVIYHWITGLPIDSIPHVCDIKGAIDFIGVFLSMFLVSVISLSRSSAILNWQIPVGLKVGLAGFASLFVGLVITCASLGEFRILEAEIYCSPVGSSSYISMSVLILHASALLIFLAITVVSYSRILLNIAFSEPDQDFKETLWVNRRPVLIRTSLIIISYFVIVLPPSVLLFLEAIFMENFSTKLNTPIDIFLVSISVLNPTLVLFAHSLISNKLAYFVRSLSN